MKKPFINYAQYVNYKNKSNASFTSYNITSCINF